MFIRQQKKKKSVLPPFSVALGGPVLFNQPFPTTKRLIPVWDPAGGPFHDSSLSDNSWNGYRVTVDKPAYNNGNAWVPARMFSSLSNGVNIRPGAAWDGTVIPNHTGYLGAVINQVRTVTLTLPAPITPAAAYFSYNGEIWGWVTTLKDFRILGLSAGGTWDVLYSVSGADHTQQDHSNNASVIIVPLAATGSYSTFKLEIIAERNGGLGYASVIASFGFIS